MSTKKTIEPKTYTQWELSEFAEKYIIASHNVFAQDEKRLGMKVYERFGEWKKNHPNHEMAKYNFPEDEYIQVIASPAHIHYFKQKYELLIDDDDELL